MPTLLHSPYAIIRPPAGSQVDWEHPLARGLCAVVLCNERSGLGPSMLVKGRGAVAPSPSVSVPTWVPSPGGGALKCASTVVHYGNLTFMDGTTTVSFVMSIRPDNLSQTAGIIQKRKPAGNTFSFGFGYNVANFFTCSMGPNTAAVCEYEFTTSGWSTTQFQQVTGACDTRLGAGARWRCWRNNLEIAATVRTENAATTGTNTDLVEIGRVNNSTLYYAGSLEYCHLYNVALRPSDVAWLYAEPFAMLRGPDVWRRYSIPGAVR